ncbi:hypothetical protein ACTNEO_20000 [Gracilibacillus sp. HCP3S3_G5_1]|uniref:hypothetical protein n=1 Tax=unclassified Gracilibacillus TaxID=2625209 RepID=UPI003F899D3B
MVIQKINPSRLLFNIELESHSSYSEHIESFLLDKTKSIEREFEDRVKALRINNDEEETLLYEYHFEDTHHSFKNDFPIILRTSLFLSMYSLLETTLRKLCKDLENNFTLKLKDVYGNGIKKTITYLTKVCSLDISKDQQELLDCYNKIRNKLAHTGHRIRIKEGKGATKDDIRLKNAVTKVSGANLDDNEGIRFVTFDKDFCEVFSQIVSTVVNNLFDTIEDAKS